MLYYAAALILTLILSHYNSKTHTLSNGLEISRLRNWRTAFLVLLPLALLAIFRWNVGVDTLYGYTYWESYQLAANFNNVRDFEPGFFLLTAIISNFGASYWVYLTILSLIFMVCMSYAIARGSVWPKWSVLVFFFLYCYFDSYNTVRQSIAEAIALIAWVKMGRQANSLKKDLQILGLFLLASMFHTIALVNIPVYLISKMRFNKSSLFRFAILAVLFTPLIQSVLRTIMIWVAGEDYTFMGFALINAIMSGVFLLFCWFFYDQICELGTNAYMYVNQALCIFILTLNSGALMLPFRVFAMLKIGYVLIIPCLLRSIKSPRVRVIMEFIVGFIIVIWFINAFFLQNSAYVPYQTIFMDFLRIIQLP